MISEELRKKIEEILKKGKAVILNPRASKVVRAENAETIDYPQQVG